MATEALILKEAEDCQKKIIYANFKAVGINAKVAVMGNLNDKQKQSLNETLKKFPKLKSEGLGTVDIEPVHLELKPGATPFHSRAYPVPKAYEILIRKVSNQFCQRSSSQRRLVTSEF